MNTKLDPSKVAQLLTQSARQLDATTLSALATARQNALKRQAASSPVFALSTGRWTYRLMPNSAQQWMASAMLVTMLVVGAGYWQQAEEQQISAVDVAILTDELPIEVFID